ncbi:hypothetical protein NDU88_007811 [Pleurodeles waltl]|uniref:Uncharacterized protein n=1 Tax=Pleurodeles waltl TaxID=8319 RepID=A0AAV7QLV4_PLEWA|nr:hypothetical protein NDU88_007811 [Pleurodeles waltl]
MAGNANGPHGAPQLTSGGGVLSPPQSVSPPPGPPRTCTAGPGSSGASPSPSALQPRLGPQGSGSRGAAPRAATSVGEPLTLVPAKSRSHGRHPDPAKPGGVVLLPSQSVSSSSRTSARLHSGVRAATGLSFTVHTTIPQGSRSRGAAPAPPALLTAFRAAASADQPLTSGPAGRCSPSRHLSFRIRSRLASTARIFPMLDFQGDPWGPGAHRRPQGSAKRLDNGSFMGRMTEGSRALSECDRHLDARSHARILLTHSTWYA